ncbi:aspartate aminotransferase family protein [Agrobacterium tumefaciens]|uniref:aspartate aminotransferase family protein n=1 Tax=Agrobacterium tumefaciens TaxID=358 RepID=UPI001571BDAC|nr:aspartate aminotransferase family protein [Agrobacterium tumefaciens]NTE68172.1 aspartate aminotransferase family protein [Agrobacterium tumefaciens]
MQQAKSLNKSSTTIASSILPKVSHGEGGYVFDTSGKKYIDGSGGPAVYSLGYGNEEVIRAITDQLNRVMHGYRYTFTSDPLEELASIITERSGPDFESMVFVSGGSEAVESSLKLALQYHTGRGEKSRRRFISRNRSWHGNTLGALSISGFKERRDAYEGALLPSRLLSPANSYRPPAGVAESDVAKHCADELENAILEIGPENVAAFVFEPVVGSAGGVVPAPPGYAALVRAICDRHGVLLIADEVMCGSGRCGTFRALEHDGVVPDIMPIAKGLGGGYVPLGAAVYNRKVGDVLRTVFGGPQTGHSFSGHTTACAAGVAVQKIMRREGLIERVKANGPRLLTLLREALEGVEAVGDIRGRGYFAGIELVTNRDTKTPFDPALQLFLKVRQRSMENGLICYPSAGNVDGVAGDTIIISPRYNATEAELAEIAEKLGKSVREALVDIGAA